MKRTGLNSFSMLTALAAVGGFIVGNPLAKTGQAYWKGRRTGSYDPDATAKSEAKKLRKQQRNLELAKRGAFGAKPMAKEIA